MNNKSLAFHETMDLHEILNFKTICLLKSKFMQGLTFNPDLRKLMERDVQQTISDIKEIQDYYLHAKFH